MDSAAADKPVTVLQVLEAWRHGGTEHYVRQIGESVNADSAVRHHVAVLRSGPDDFETLLPWAAAVHPLAGDRLAPPNALRRLVLDLRPEIVHLHLYASMGAVLHRLRPLDIPRLGVTFHFGVDRWRWHRRRGWRRAVRDADFATATSRRSADSFGPMAGRIEVVYPALPRGLPAKADPGEAAGSGPLRVLGCGRMTAEKDWPTLLRAIHMLRPHADVDCTLIGEGRLRGELESLADALGIGEVVRFRDNLPQPAVLEAMAEADVFVVPSRFEGFGMAAAEAMAIGVPTVVSAGVAAGELLVKVVEPPEACWPLRFPVGNWRALADRLLWHHRHRPRSWELARRIAPAVRKALAQERTVERFASLYRGAAPR